MKKIYEKKIHALALTVFSQAEIAIAKKDDDPIGYLVHATNGLGAWGREIFPGCLGYQTVSGKVRAFGKDADNRIDFEHPLLEVSVKTLARSALAGMYQESFMELVQESNKESLA
jgi:hypothetical protein